MTDHKAVTQLRLPFPRAQVTKAMLSTREGSWVLDLTIPGSPFALPVATALAVGVPAAPNVQKGLSDCFASGFARDNFRELFLVPGAIPGAAGILTLEQNKQGGWQAKLSDGLMPYVLTKDAVSAGEMPALGASGLPASLEACVPAAYRYWEQTDIEQATQVRDALVEAEFFAESMLKVVDGDIRLCVQQLYLYEPEAALVEPASSPEETAPTYDAAEAAFAKMLDTFDGPIYTPMEVGDSAAERDAALRTSAQDATGLVLLSTDTEAATLTKALLSAGAQGEWCLAASDSTEARAAFEAVGRPFVFKGDPERTLFVASIAPPLPDVLWVTSASETQAPDDTVSELAEAVNKRVVGIVKATDGVEGEERYVLGVVLEPELIDAQQDVYDEATIKTAAHKFMTDFRTVGLMHKGAINDKVKILESYIAPVDLDFDGAPVKKGAWVMAVRVLDDALWEDVKSGALTGFSIGGTALRKPD